MVELIDEIIYFPTDSKSLLFFTQDQYMIEELQQQKHIFRSNLYESIENTWRNEHVNEVSLLVQSTVMQTTQLLFWRFLMSTQYFKIKQSVYSMIPSLLSTTNKMQRYTIFFIIVNALHVSGGLSAHHQELKNCTHSIWYVPDLIDATASQMLCVQFLSSW